MGRIADAIEQAEDGDGGAVASPAPASASSTSAKGSRGSFAALAEAELARRANLYAFPSEVEEKLVGGGTIDPVTREQYRKLAAVLHRARAEHGRKVIMLTSAVAGEGKTLTAANLALTLSDSYEREILLIDADLRNPKLQATFGVPIQAADSQRREDAPFPVVRIRPRLSLMATSRQNDPIGILTSPEMRRTIEDARDMFDWVLIDTPPVGLLPDASLLTSMVDGVILVIAAGTTPYPIVQHAADAVGRERLLGVVLNRANPRHLISIDHYGHYAALERRV
jgi:protein-tyrosine kinase